MLIEKSLQSKDDIFWDLLLINMENKRNSDIGGVHRQPVEQFPKTFTRTIFNFFLYLHGKTPTYQTSYHVLKSVLNTL